MEVMIAMAILAIALVAVFQSQSQSISMEGNSRFLTTASLLAQSRMAEVEAMGLDNIITNSGDFGDQFPDYTWNLEVKDTENEYMKKIEVTVTNQKLVMNNTYILVLYALFTK
jgi:general secretion pathway protein I